MMNPINKIVYLLLFIFFPPCIYAQQASDGINQLGDALVTALQNNDVEAFMQVHLTPKDLEEFNKKTSKLTKRTKQSRNDAEGTLETMEESSQATFEEVVQKGITEQINWKEINFSGVDNITQMQKEGDLYVINNPVVRFMYKDTERKLRINKIAKLDRGWVVVDNVSLE